MALRALGALCAVSPVMGMLDQFTADQLIQSVYTHLSASGNSAGDTDRNGGTGELLYGELTASAVATLLQTAGAKSSDHFYDLGSGNGKIVWQGFMQYNFAVSVGLEIADSRHNQACQAMDTFVGNYTNPGPIPAGNYGTVTFEKADLLTRSFSDADIVIGGLMPNDDFMKSLVTQFSLMKEGSNIFLLHEIPKEACKGYLEIKPVVKVPGSWSAQVDAHHYIRKNGAGADEVDPAALADPYAIGTPAVPSVSNDQKDDEDEKEKKNGNGKGRMSIVNDVMPSSAPNGDNALMPNGDMPTGDGMMKGNSEEAASFLEAEPSNPINMGTYCTHVFG